jgi:hypothetical protein
MVMVNSEQLTEDEGEPVLDEKRLRLCGRSQGARCCRKAPVTTRLA